MHVADLMNRELVTVAPGDSVEQAVKLLHRRGIRHLLVLRKGRLVGIVSDRDIKRSLDPQTTRKKIVGVGGLYFLLEPVLVEEIMTADPVTVPPQTDVHQAAWIMVERRFGALPVVEGGRTVGIVTETDLLRYFAEQALDRPSAKSAEGPAQRARKRRS